MDDDDWADIADIQAIFSRNRNSRKVKVQHDRKDWNHHLTTLLAIGKFEQHFRMPHHHFDYLLNAVRDAITVDFARSKAGSNGNDPIYPEIVLAVGLRFLGVGDTVAGLADLYGMSEGSCVRCINMFLDAIDYNHECPELQVCLPDPKNNEELTDLANRWSSISTVYGLFTHNLGCMDGWLPFTTAPDVPNQADYYSGHYQSHGLNVQAMCDPDLLFFVRGCRRPR